MDSIDFEIDFLFIFTNFVLTSMWTLPIVVPRGDVRTIKGGLVDDLFSTPRLVG